MARARRAAAGSTSKETGTSDGTLTCPECGKTFTRAASLGAHRSRAHGVAGASARRTRRRAGASNGGATRRRRSTQRQAQTSQQTTRRRSRGASSDGSRTSVNRDQLLQALFPNGLPAREEVIRRANAWLDEAERLAKSK